MMAGFFPELAGAEIRQRQQGEDTLYDLVRRVGTKGQEEKYRVEVYLTNWISTPVLAAAVMEALSVAGTPVTLENARKVWLGFLGKELSDGLGRAARALQRET